MSYILDALRRAEAERSRGGVPGLHTPTALSPDPALGGGRPAGLNPRAVVLTVTAVAALAAGATWWTMRPGVHVAATSAPAPAAPSVPAGQAGQAGQMARPDTTPAPRPADTVAAPAVTAADANTAGSAAVPALPAPATAVVPRPPLPAPAAAPSTSVAPTPRAAEKRAAAPARERPAAASPSPAPAPPSRPAAAAQPPASPDSAARNTAAVEGGRAAAPEGSVVFAQNDLPEAVRAQLPAIKVTGATHSSNPAFRMAIVNGEVLHEGSQAGPGLRLERIEPGRTVWSFRGYRYAVPSQQ